MHAKQQRAFQADQLFSGGDIGQHHEFFDQAVRVKPFGKGNRADLAIVTQHDLAFGQVKFQRLARCAGAFKRLIGAVKCFDPAHQGRSPVIAKAVLRRLHLRIRKRAL